MSRWRVYIKPFDQSGNYQTDFIEVTDAVTGTPSSIKTQLDDTEFDVGVLRNSSITIKLNNITGSYSDVGETGSIFNFKRKDSLVRFTWELTPDILECGFFNAGEDSSLLSEQKVVFEGLLNDDSLRQDVFSQFIEFKVLGREDFMNRASVDISSISNGDLTSVALYTMLNQSPINDILTVDQANITVSSDQTIDDKTILEGLTVFEAVKNFLRVSNSVLYIDADDKIIVSPRTPGSTVAFSFFGQASIFGIENIQQLNSVSNGVNRVFNFVQWSDTATVRSDPTSITKFGVKKREIGFSVFTTTAKQEDMLDNFIAEFATAKQELDISTPFNYSSIDLNLLDRVEIDYPTVVTSTDALPIVGIATLGDPLTPLPSEQSAFVIDTSRNYKITNKTIDVKKDTVKYHLREI